MKRLKKYRTAGALACVTGAAINARFSRRKEGEKSVRKQNVGRIVQMVSQPARPGSALAKCWDERRKK